MIAIVTGASSGVGKLFAEELITRYPKLREVWVIARRKEPLEQLASEYPDKIVPLVLDLGDESSVLFLKEQLSVRKPKVKFLVNAAGAGFIGDFEKLPLEEQLSMLRVNVIGLTAVTHAVLPYMVRNSRLIQIASSAAFLPQPHFAVYAASKAYVRSVTLALAGELRSREIYPTVVCPGPMQTEFFDRAETYEKIADYKKNFMYDPRQVVQHAMEASIHKKRTATFGLSMKCVKLLSSFLPEILVYGALYKADRK